MTEIQIKLEKLYKQRAESIGDFEYSERDEETDNENNA